MEAGAKPRHLWKRMEASGAVPPGRTEKRGRQPKNQGFVGVTGRKGG